MNNIVLSGEVIELSEIKELRLGINYSRLTISVPRNSANENDTIVVTLWNTIAESAEMYCTIGNTILIKGYLQSYCIQKEKENFYNYEVVAKQILFSDKN